MAAPGYIPPPESSATTESTFESTQYIVVPPGWTQVSESSFYSGNSVITMVAAKTLNVVATAKTQRQTQATVGGTNTLLPVVYGTQRVGGRIFAVKIKSDGHLIVGVAWCHGEVDSIVSQQINDIALPASVTVTNYTGTSGQTYDATLAAVIAGYTDNLANVCYSVFNISPKATTGFPRFNAVIKGKKISSTSGGAKAYSENPAYIIADFIENTTYGMGRSVDWATVATLASACSALVGGEAKRLLNIVLDSSHPGEQWLQTLRDYAGCFIVPEGGSYRLVPNTTGSSVYSFTSANIVAESLRLTKRGTGDQPTMVEVIYTDTSVLPYREARYCTAVVAPRRLSRISKPGITRHSEAVRYAIERLNDATLCDLSAVFETFDAGLALQVGDLIDITHPIGLTTKVMRVSRVDPVSPGRWRIAAVEYDAAVYDSSVATAPTTPDTSIASPSDTTQVATWGSLTILDERMAGGLWSRRVKYTWNAPAWPYVAYYKIWLYRSFSGIEANSYDMTDSTEWVSPAVRESERYDFYVAVVSVTGTVGPYTKLHSDDLYPVDGVGIGATASAPTAALTVATEIAKATATTTTATTFGSSDTPGTSDLALNVRQGGSATQSARWTGLSSYENGYGAQPLVLQDLGGNVLIGSTVDVAGSRLVVKGGSINLDEQVAERAIGFNVDSTFSLSSKNIADYGLTYDASALASYSVTLAAFGNLEFFSGRARWQVISGTGVFSYVSSKAGLPTSSDIADGFYGVWKNNSDGKFYLCINSGGTIKKVELT